MRKKMMAGVLHAPGKIQYEEIGIPEIGKNDVLVKVAYCGICGSDLARTQHKNGARKYPLVIGHEFSGTIVKIGEQVSASKIGDKVCVAPLIPDPESDYTKAGLYGLSDNYTIIGTGTNGAMAEYVRVPERHVVLLPDGMSLLDAAGIEPAAIAFHAYRQSGIQAGDTVAVLGCGTIGQFAIQCAKVFGASKIAAVDIFDDKLELAKKLGATVVINSGHENLAERIKEETGLGVHVVMETAGSCHTQEQALMIARKQGKIVYVGISHTELLLQAGSAEKILRSELTIKGSWNSYTAPYPGRDWEGTLHFMQKGDIVFEPMISHHISLNELDFYTKGMFDRSIPFNKVIVDIHPES